MAALQGCSRGGAPPPAIDLWHGSQQVFGVGGVPQRWVNVLGRASPAGSIRSLSYSLNGGPETPLSMGPDSRRLEAPGDFNIEIDYKDLAPGPNHLRIVAVGQNRVRTVKTMALDYAPRAGPRLEQTIDWSAVRSIQQVAQVVDGHWSLTPEGVRSAERGYDRIIAIGDISWTDYEVSVPVTVHSMHPRFANPAGGAAVGVVLRWTGHVVGRA